MATAALNVGDILAVLFSRADPDTFHWAICVPLTTKTAAKYHAKGSGGQWWFEDPVPNEDLVGSPIVSAAVKIGSLRGLNVNPDTEAVTPVSRDAFGDILSRVPLAVPEADEGREPEFTCRVWWREAIRRLHVEGIISCPDVDGLERECRKHALDNQAHLESYRGYRYYVSQISA